MPIADDVILEELVEKTVMYSGAEVIMMFLLDSKQNWDFIVIFIAGWPLRDATCLKRET